jgi:hypothetical protein
MGATSLPVLILKLQTDWSNLFKTLTNLSYRIKGGF